MNKNEKDIINSFLDLENTGYEIALQTLKLLIILLVKAEYTTKEILKKWHKIFATKGILSTDDVKQVLTKKELREFKKLLNRYLDECGIYEVEKDYIEELEDMIKANKISRLKMINTHIKHNYTITYAKIYSLINDMIIDVYTNTFYNTAYLIQKYKHRWFKIDKINKLILSELIYTTWANDEVNIRDRINILKTNHVSKVQDVVLKSVVYERLIEDTLNKISNISDVEKRRIGRLTRTEESFFNSLSQLNVYRYLEIEEYQIVAVIDNRTSDICRHLNGKRFYTKDFEHGVTAPPFHPNCRSTTRPYVYRENYGVFKPLDYDEWKKKYIK